MMAPPTKQKAAAVTREQTIQALPSTFPDQAWLDNQITFEDIASGKQTNSKLSAAAAEEILTAYTKIVEDAGLKCNPPKLILIDEIDNPAPAKSLSTRDGMSVVAINVEYTNDLYSLKGMIGHEIAHIALRHTTVETINTELNTLARIANIADPMGQTTPEQFTKVRKEWFSFLLAQEIAADDYVAKKLHLGHEFAAALKKFDLYQQYTKATEDSRIHIRFETENDDPTHPFIVDRVARAEAIANNLDEHPQSGLPANLKKISEKCPSPKR